MASHQLAIAKATFSAGLLRPDPTSLPREEIARFHSLLDTAVLECTPRNVQTCKRWILEHILHSTGRFAALGRYLTALSASFDDTRPPPQRAEKREPSIKRRRLHLLYLVNDILYHAKYRAGDASVSGKIQPILVDLLGGAAAFAGCPKHQRKIAELLDLWEEKDYYSREYVDKLRETARNASDGGNQTEGVSAAGDAQQAGSSVKMAKSAPFVMPAMHGDLSTPWFDLPAGNLMPHIVPNSTRPINPAMIKPLQFVAGPADETLVAAVKGLLRDVQDIFDGETDPDEKLSWDIDELGQPIILDEITGEVIEGEGYYGWSRTFCEKMKRRRKGVDAPDDRGRDGSSRSRSSSRGAKRRRRSVSESSSAGRRPLHRRSSYSSSRSPSRSPARRGRNNGRSGSPSRDRSYSRSRSPDLQRPTDGRSFQPLPPPEAFPPNPTTTAMPFVPQPATFQNGFNTSSHHFLQPPPPPPPPPPHPNAAALAQQQYGSWPVPPLRPPPFANAPWPPPPPPPLPQTYPSQQQQGQGGFQPPPPAPGSGWAPQGTGRGYSGGWNSNRSGRGSGGGVGGGHRGRGWS